MSEENIQNTLAIVGALVPLLSALASALNHVIRSKQSQGQDVSPLMLQAGSVLNVASINLDKAVQLGRMARAISAQSSAPSAPSPAELAPQEARPEPLVCTECGAKIGIS